MGNFFPRVWTPKHEYILPVCISPFPYPSCKIEDEDRIWWILGHEGIHCRGIKMHHKYAYALIKSSDLERLQKVLPKYTIRGGMPLSAHVRVREGEVTSVDMVVSPYFNGF